MTSLYRKSSDPYYLLSTKVYQSVNASRVRGLHNQYKHIDSIPSGHWIGNSMALTRSLRTFTTNIWRLFNNCVLLMYGKYTKPNPLSRIMCSVALGKLP